MYRKYIRIELYKSCKFNNLYFKVISKLKEDLTVKENIIKKDTITKVESLKSELNQSKLNFETKIKTIENEKEIEINRVYVRYDVLIIKINIIYEVVIVIILG